MSREILFKAKGTETGIWRYGYLIPLPNMNPEHRPLHIFDDTTQEWYEIDPSTVCQYTGLCSKDGQLIFEGDILEARFDDKHPEDVARVVVKWILFGWYLYQADNILPDEMDETDIDLWTVVGNIWDNPELLEGGTGEDD